MSVMLGSIGVFSSLLFLAGIACYWAFSGPLKSLPNWHELVAIIEKEKLKNHNGKTGARETKGRV